MKILKFHELITELKNTDKPAEVFEPESMDGITVVGPLHDDDDTVKYFKQNDDVDKDKLAED
jgi:hypothetical protein